MSHQASRIRSTTFFASLDKFGSHLEKLPQAGVEIIWRHGIKENRMTLTFFETSKAQAMIAERQISEFILKHDCDLKSLGLNMYKTSRVQDDGCINIDFAISRKGRLTEYEVTAQAIAVISCIFQREIVGLSITHSYDIREAGKWEDEADLFFRLLRKMQKKLPTPRTN